MANNRVYFRLMFHWFISAIHCRRPSAARTLDCFFVELKLPGILHCFFCWAVAYRDLVSLSRTVVIITMNSSGVWPSV